jgi:hypothetical protein
MGKMGMDRRRDALGAIETVIKHETRFLRSYIGQVVSTADEMTKGRVSVFIPGVGHRTKGDALWCWPEGGHALTVPSVDEFVTVRFLEGDSNWPVYRIGVARMQGGVPEGYVQGSHVIWEDPAGGEGRLGGGTFKGAARVDDRTEVDAVTDPTNVPFLIAVCAIFGMTLTPPLVGKIAEGSAQIKVGD